MEARKTPWLTLVVVVVVLAGAFLYYQQFNNYRLERETLAQEEQALTAAQTRLAAVKKLQEQRDQLEADLELLTQLLPDQAGEDKLLVDLQSGADQAKMDFLQIRFSDRVTNQGYVGMPMQLQLNGTYHELLYFLDYLEFYDRALRIDELRVDESEENGLSINIRASAFYAADATSAAE